MTKVTDEKMSEQRGAKDRLRISLLGKRSKIAPADRCIWDSQLALELLRLPEYQQARTLLTFLSTPWEVSTQIPVACAIGMGKVVAAPRWGGGRMEFCPFTDYEQLIPGRKGILQPLGELAPLTDFTDALCIVPALAVESHGLRIGYGGGYYDRFLKNFSGFSVVLAYPEMLCEELPTEPHDLPVNAILTPGKTIRISSYPPTGRACPERNDYHYEE